MGIKRSRGGGRRREGGRGVERGGKDEESGCVVKWIPDASSFRFFYPK